jgi:hypothetical protein
MAPGILTANEAVVVGGRFVLSSSPLFGWNLAYWDASGWSYINGGLGFASSEVRTLAALPDGFLAGGEFTQSGFTFVSNPVRYRYGQWWQIAPQFTTVTPFGSVRALAVLPNGDVLAGVLAAPGAATALLARWNGTVWQSLPALGGASPNAVEVFGTRADGTLLAGGTFSLASAAGTHHAARLDPTCPAATTISGSPCAGSAGLLTLAADNAPWTGSTFTVRAAPFAAGSLAFHVLGFGTQSVPLATLHPAAGAGCALLVTPDAATLGLPVGGIATWTVSLPNAPVLAGIVLHDQAVQMELDVVGNLVLLTSSNRLSATIGSY